MKITLKTQEEIKGLNTPDLIQYYGKVKAEEARAEEQFVTACRNVVVGGITHYHQSLLDQIQLIEQRLKQ